MPTSRKSEPKTGKFGCMLVIILVILFSNSAWKHISIPQIPVTSEVINVDPKWLPPPIPQSTIELPQSTNPFVKWYAGEQIRSIQLLDVEKNGVNVLITLSYVSSYGVQATTNDQEYYVTVDNAVDRDGNPGYNINIYRTSSGESIAAISIIGNWVQKGSEPKFALKAIYCNNCSFRKR